MKDKICTKCKKVYPINKFGIDKTRPDGYSYVCSYCRNPSKLANEIRHKELLESYRVCTGCGIKKLKEDFGVDARQFDGKKSKCKKCYAEIMRQDRKEYPEKYKIIGKRSRNKNYEDKVIHRSMYMKKYYDLHKKELFKKHKIWVSENRDQVRTDNASRRARLLKAPGDGVTKEQWQAIKELFNNKCVYPGCENKNLAIDHIVPLVCGGHHAIYNVQPLCTSHNSFKHTKKTDYRGFVGKNFIGKLHP